MRVIFGEQHNHDTYSDHLHNVGGHFVLLSYRVGGGLVQRDCNEQRQTLFVASVIRDRGPV